MGVSVGLILCVVSAVFFLLTMCLEAAAAAGDPGNRPKSSVIGTTVLPAFALVGSILGLLTAILGALLQFTGMFASAKHLRFIWVLLGLIALWFVAGATGIWSSWRKFATNSRNRPDLFEACLAFEIMSSIVWLATLAFVCGGEELTKQ